jgi:hypothetical protein
MNARIAGMGEHLVDATAGHHITAEEEREGVYRAVLDKG